MIHLHYRVREGGIPILKDREIEEDARYLLFQYDKSLLTDPHPLDVEDFTERFLGFSIHYENLSFNGCIWGMMVFNNQQIIVYDPEKDSIAFPKVDANTVVIDNSLLDMPNEYAFRSTMIHECGHGLYHPQIYRIDENQMSLFPLADENKLINTGCRSTDIQGSGKRKLVTDLDWIEHHAKYFSAAVLMPRSAMDIVCGDKDMRESLIKTAPGYELDTLALKVSETFNVSPASAKIRITQLGYGFEESNQQSLFTA